MTTTTTPPAAPAANPSTSNPATPAAVPQATPVQSKSGFDRFMDLLDGAGTRLGNSSSTASAWIGGGFRGVQRFIIRYQRLWTWLPVICAMFIGIMEYCAMYVAIYPVTKAALMLVGYGLPALYFIALWTMPVDIILSPVNSLLEFFDSAMNKDLFNADRWRLAIRNRIRIPLKVCFWGMALRSLCPTPVGLWLFAVIGALTVLHGWYTEVEEQNEVEKARALVSNPIAKSFIGLSRGGLRVIEPVKFALVAFLLLGLTPQYLYGHYVDCRKTDNVFQVGLINVASLVGSGVTRYNAFFADTAASGWRMEFMALPGTSTMGPSIEAGLKKEGKSVLGDHFYVSDELGKNLPMAHIERCFSRTPLAVNPVTSPLNAPTEIIKVEPACVGLMMVNEVTQEVAEKVAGDRWSWDDAGTALKESSLKRLTSNEHTQAIIRSNLKVATDPACWMDPNGGLPNHCIKARARYTVSAYTEPGYSWRCWRNWFYCDTVTIAAYDLRAQTELLIQDFGLPAYRVPVDAGKRFNQFLKEAQASAVDTQYAMCTNHPAYDSFNIADWEDKAPNAVKNERDWKEEAKTNPALQSVRADLAKIRAIEAGTSALSPHGAPAKVAKEWGADFRDNNAWWWFLGGLALIAFLLKWLLGGVGKAVTAATAKATALAAVEKVSQIAVEQAGATSGKGGGGDSHAKPHASPKPKGGGDAHAPHH